jgi:hypothetical protein
MFGHVGFQQRNTEISWRINCSFYQNMYHCRSESACGSHTMVRHYIFAISLYTLRITPSITDREVDEDTLIGPLAHLT